ncbi:sialic acid-binding Ig-like lectin 5 [Astatotilapia calliptera]|uniref:sialic acid-binding Ig-like lectin 5 n=1 Tax=Astatotilapia calliptera TaxID=8154 RepID=UPI000E3FBCB2|nr:sialic acid-binding Ig-like lectin 5 [Astatotilapia calliptera]
MKYYSIKLHSLATKMAATLTFLLVSSLLQGALCGTFNVNIPQKINVLRGSCVNIPCSFNVRGGFENNLDDSCKAYWSDSTSFDSENAKLKPTKEMTGDLTKKDCTTTFNNASLLQSAKYYFRLQCNNPLRFTFTQAGVDISLIDDPPSPTLTPSTLEVEEGASVSLTCSAPAPCWSHPPALTWSSNLGQSQETLQENQDKTKVRTSVMNFNASHLHHGNKISCTAVYQKQDGIHDVTAETSLTPDISYSPKNITVSVSPSGPVPENSNVTLTCSSNANPAVENYTWYSADGNQETFIGTGMSLSIRVSKDRRILFCKAGNEIGVGGSGSIQIEVQYPPQILFSSHCTSTESQLNCSCETLGNPSPNIQWYLNGLTVNHSKCEIFNETLNRTILRSFFTLNQPHKKNHLTLICRTVNSLGSASQQFCVSSQQVSTEHQLLYPAIISTLGVLLLALLLCVFFIRAQKSPCKNKGHLTDENNTVATSQPLTEEGNEEPNTAEECIYANADGLRGAENFHPANIAGPSSTNFPNSGPNHAEGGCKKSDKKEDECELIYSDVNWKMKSKKKKGEKSLDMNPSARSYLEEEKCTVRGVNRKSVSNAVEMGGLYAQVEPRNMRKEVGCEYAQVKFKEQSAMQK